MTDEFPTFDGPDLLGLYYVNWRGRRWGMLTPIMDNWQLDQWRAWETFPPGPPRVELSFRMVAIPDPIDPFEDHPCIVRGDN